VTFEIDTVEDMVRRNVIHSNFKPGSIVTTKIVKGWPLVLSRINHSWGHRQSYHVMNVIAALKQSCGDEVAT
jgi:hypothetical protein